MSIIRHFFVVASFARNIPKERSIEMKAFFGIGGYLPAEGYLSWQHLTFVSSLMVILIGLAIFVGLRQKSKTYREKNSVLIITAILIDSLEIFKIVFFGVRDSNPMIWVSELPLFLCSIQLIAIPLAAFSKGRLRDAALDFVLIFGMLGAVFGTYGAGQNYAAYPVLSFPNVISGITHSISGFASLYIGISGMAGMKKKNMPITFGILGGFCAAAYIVNSTVRNADGELYLNYMFLMRDDGTPYQIFYNLVSGNKILYPLIVVALFLLYITLFYLVIFFIRSKRSEKQLPNIKS